MTKSSPNIGTNLTKIPELSPTPILSSTFSTKTMTASTSSQSTPNSYRGSTRTTGLSPTLSTSTPRAIWFIWKVGTTSSRSDWTTQGLWILSRWVISDVCDTRMMMYSYKWVCNQNPSLLLSLDLSTYSWMCYEATGYSTTSRTLNEA